MPARTIDEVIEHLDDLIAHARRAKSRLGYFAALYLPGTLGLEPALAGAFLGDKFCALKHGSAGNQRTLGEGVAS